MKSWFLINPLRILKYSTVIGFGCATLGSILLGYASDTVIEVDTELLTYVAGHSSTADYSGVPSSLTDKVAATLDRARIVNWFGVLFFVLGFAIQLGEAVRSTRENLKS
jgi:hypothetical protein